MGNPQYTQFLRIIQREGTAQKQKKDRNIKESEEVKYEENEKSHGSVTQLSHGTCNERSSICNRRRFLQQAVLTQLQHQQQVISMRSIRSLQVIYMKEHSPI